jgi:cytochrome c556
MMRKLLLLSVLTTVTATAALASPLQQAIAQRQAGYKELGKSMRAAKQALDKGDAAAVRGSANQIAALTGQAPRWFPAGSGPEAGKTAAKPAIWQQRADFDSKMRNFGAAAQAFRAAAAGGDLNAMKAAHGRLGQTCGACHEPYRAKDD